MAEKATKKAIGWKKVTKRNGKPVKVNTNYISPSPNLPYLRTAVKTSLPEKLYTEWEDNWHGEMRGRIIYKIAPTPSKNMLHFHEKSPKWVNSLIIQMRTSKIGLKKFFYKQNLPGIKDMKCACDEGKEIVRYVPTKCSRFAEM